MHVTPPGNAARYWEPPSERVAELIRAAVGRLLDNPKDVYARVDEAVLATGSPRYGATEPGFADALRASVRANISHWATASLKAPGMPVTPNIGPENVDLARDVVRHGFDTAILTNFHAGQNAAIQTWTAMAFALTDDVSELREFIDVVSRSLFAYVDDTLAALYEMIETERGQIADVDHAARLEAVGLVLKGAPITVRRASQRLRYELDRHHLAAIVWADRDPADAGALERAVTALGQAAGAVRPLTILTSPATMWVWLSGTDVLDIADVAASLKDQVGARIAIGSQGWGLAGFRRGHLDAVVTQRLMRRISPDHRVAIYDDVELVALTTGNEERAAEFVGRTLGDFAHADSELRETVRVYLREGSSTTAAAKALYAHRNTVVNRLDRARALLPRPLEQRTLQVALALEIVRVIGAPAQD